MTLRMAWKDPNTWDPNAWETCGIGVEIQSFVLPMTESKEQEWEEKWSEHLLKATISPGLHGPFIDMRPASMEKDIVAVTRKRYLESLQRAHRLGASYIVFHSQILPMHRGRTQSFINAATAPFWHEVLAETDFRGRVLIENVYEEDPNELKLYFRDMKHAQLGLLLDVGHAKLSGLPLEEWAVELGEQVEVIHIHDNDGLQDRHLPVADGTREEILRIYGTTDVAFTFEMPVASPGLLREEWSRS